MSVHWYKVQAGADTFLVESRTIGGVRRSINAGFALTSIHTMYGRIPLVALRDIVGAHDDQQPQPMQYLLLVRLIEGWCGIVVDRVDELALDQPLLPLPALVHQVGYAPLVTGVMLLDDHPVVVLDIHTTIAHYLARTQRTRLIQEDQL